MTEENFTPPETGGEEAKFNMGLALLQRINELFYMYDGQIISGKLIQASETLELVYDEIDFTLDAKEKEFVQKQEKFLREFIKKNPRLDETKVILKDGMRNIFFIFPGERNLFKINLRIFVRLLKKLMKDHGLLMPKRGEQDLF